MAGQNADLQGDVVYPPEQIVENANAKDWQQMQQRAADDLEGFWEEEAEKYHWFDKWDQVLDDSNPPFYKWFTGGKTNLAYNCLDVHVKNSNRNKLALIWEGENGEQRTFSYYALYRETCKFANILKALGVEKGDRVTLYMGPVPETVMAMLACARIGAIHSVVFAGFSKEALRERVEDSQSKLVITQDAGYRNGSEVPLKQTVDKAIRHVGFVENVLVVKRTGTEVHMEQGRDHWYHELAEMPIASRACEAEEMDAEDMLYLLYTSGTTGKPKAIVHTTGGYMVGIATTLRYVFDLKPSDRFWCAADPGWVTGHSYIVYGPLLLGATNFMYEGAPTYPYPNRWWKMIEYYGLNILYTAPTAVRGLMRFGRAWPDRHDLSSLRLLGSVGEPINPEAWKWYHDVIGYGECPIMDTWWQTETGGFMITPVPSMPLKPGSATKPFFGVEADVVNDDGESVDSDEEGYLVIKKPWPSMLRTLYKDEERFKETYWSKFEDQGWYLAGDSAKKDEDGYFWVIGRIDDVLNVAGHRLGTAEVESALVSHDAVAEAAVIGVPDDVKGNAIHAYVILTVGYEGSEDLMDELVEHVAEELGPIAKPANVEAVDSLPKTRSGKIMRRVLRAKAMGEEVGDLSTMAD
ncbi:MAG: acetate--CoA ligase [Candidatus Marinimicrobia bacterium]|nr:acetate--CoA ligase [Candidatus Neomarinimicrobiota bacterium]MCF7829154.1 acetate--CoA ligase [Candidatus Neomarinimicrobiota bacterium]MCF7881193.1 acetate--CoA ligase [Candidatus Neomarinimicrobiota bacterium]